MVTESKGFLVDLRIWGFWLDLRYYIFYRRTDYSYNFLEIYFLPRCYSHIKSRPPQNVEATPKMLRPPQTVEATPLKRGHIEGHPITAAAVKAKNQAWQTKNIWTNFKWTHITAIIRRRSNKHICHKAFDKSPATIQGYSLCKCYLDFSLWLQLFRLI